MCLHKLENEGYIRSYYKEKDGRQRRYYAITDRGIKQLAEEKEQWKRFSFAVNKVIGVKQMPSPETREFSVEARQAPSPAVKEFIHKVVNRVHFFPDRHDIELELAAH